MSDEEALTAYNQLSDLLRKLDLDWILSQVEEEIREGKSQVVRVPNFKEVRDANLVFDFGTNRRLVRKGYVNRLLITNYSSKQRLNLLLDALEIALVDQALIITDVLGFFKEEIGQNTIISFGNTEDTDLVQPLTITSQDVTSILNISKELQGLIYSLQERLNS